MLLYSWLKVTNDDLTNDHSYNVASFLSNVAQIHVENENVASTLFNVTSSNVGVLKVVPTLILRCLTSQRHIN